MNEKQRQRIIDKHRDSLTRYGHHPHALYWSGRDIQELRFQVLSRIGIRDGDSVLDVGCGFGDFKAWAAGQGMDLSYTGVDLSPDLLEKARGYHPHAVFAQGDIFDLDAAEQSYDWVILSGALNEQLHDGSAYAKSVTKRMYALCRKGVAFNMLDARHIQAHDLHSQQPDHMLAYCQVLCPDCTLKDDYLKNDFTVYMRRGGSLNRV